MLKVSEPQKRMRRGSDILIVLLYCLRSDNARGYRNIRGEMKASLIMQAEIILGYEHGGRGLRTCSSFGAVDCTPLMMLYVHKSERSHSKLTLHMSIVSMLSVPGIVNALQRCSFISKTMSATTIALVQ